MSCGTGTGINAFIPDNCIVYWTTWNGNLKESAYAPDSSCRTRLSFCPRSAKDANVMPKTGAACIKLRLSQQALPANRRGHFPARAPFSDYVFVYDEPVLTGSFARFGAPDIVCTAEQDTELRTAILERLDGETISAGALSADRIARMGFDRELDHGILVPLYFLQQAGTATKIVGLSSPAMDIAALKRIGQCIAAAARDAGRNVCVVASGICRTR